MPEERAAPVRIKMPAGLSRRQLECSRTDMQVIMVLVMAWIVVGMLYDTLAGLGFLLFSLFCMFRWDKARTYRLVWNWCVSFRIVRVFKTTLWRADDESERSQHEAP